MKLITLYRPVGQKELDLVKASGYKRFPPRLAWQPIFYPVMNQAYAEQIALEWNTKDEFSGYAGYVTAFDLPEVYCSNSLYKTWVERYTMNCGCRRNNWSFSMKILLARYVL